MTVYVLGGSQTDFAVNWSREGKGLFDLIDASAHATLEASGVDPAEIQVGHVGNFAGELYTGQGHLGGFLAEADPAWHEGLPTSRHEAACASGSIAVLAAMRDLEAGHYDVALVVGVEQMRTLGTFESQRALGAAAWVPDEIDGVDYPWPQLFSDLGDEYDRRYGLKAEHLSALSEAFFANAKNNPNAQTRKWEFTDRSFCADDEANPPVAGRIRRQDCSQVTDGAAGVVLVSEREFERRGRPSGASRISGWGHITGRMRMDTKLEASRDDAYVAPHLRRAVTDAWKRAGINGPADIDCVETHDCFSTTAYAAIDHLGLTEPGESYKAIEDGTVFMGGSCPLNPSGGLTGCGHPVGATGVRMLLDQHKQVTGTAGDYQVDGARTAQTLNVGGNLTTVVSLVVQPATGE